MGCSGPLVRRGTHRGQEDREKWGTQMAGYTNCGEGRGNGWVPRVQQGYAGKGREEGVGTLGRGGPGPLWRAGQRVGPTAVPECP